MIAITSALLLAASDVSAAATENLTCYASKHDRSDQVVIIGKSDRAEFAAKGLRQVNCPTELAWTPAAARAQCAFLAHYDPVMAAYFVELHGVSPNEACDAGREAAGLKPQWKRNIAD
ncbi:MAG: hypothetical protein ACX939_02745 [Hyphococcus sp.]